MSSQGNLGVIALGDSIANGHGDMVNDVQSHSWAFWLAQAADLPFTRYSVGGSTSRDVLAAQVPRLQGRRYDLAAVSVGTNDALRDVPPDTFGSNLDEILDAASAAAERVVLTNLSTIVGQRPGARDKLATVRRFNEVIAATAEKRGALLVDISGFKGARLMRADRVHPSALGQLQIAVTAADKLRDRGLAIGDPADFTLGHPAARTSPGHAARYCSRTLGVATRNAVKRAIGRG